MNRRSFLQSVSEALTTCAVAGMLPVSMDPTAYPTISPASGIDRRALVARHNPVVRSIDPFATLSVGNGSFAFTADITGLQTFPEAYAELPLATQAEWGWHAFPNPNGYRLENALAEYEAGGRRVPYASLQETPAGRWLRENPHRLSLARVGFDLRRRDGTPAVAEDVHDVRQHLDLWNGTLVSRFRLEGREIYVRTWVHPQRDALAVRLEAPELAPGQLAIHIAFPYGAHTHTGDPADWNRADLHRTDVLHREAREVTWRRVMDQDRYFARAEWTDTGAFEQQHPHVFRLEPAQTRDFGLVVSFSPDAPQDTLPDVDEVGRASANHWNRFWSNGGALDLSGSTDPRAPELERRIILSQYLTAIQCAGSMPPQETGLTFNSWYGKAHLEMHWWHAAHFALWNRVDLLERSLPWYRSILPPARETARSQGYAGVRWPKMVGPAGRESPSSVGVFLIWQQPHPIYYAELVYRSRPETAVLETYRDLVFESAAFMASYARWDEAARRYVLGPPLIPAQEIHPPETTFNPTFELAYWAFGLETAQQWRERLGLPRELAWDRVLRLLSPLPMRDGLYVNAESAPRTFTDPDQRRDHPSLLGAFAFIPSRRVDREAMRRTLRQVLKDWQWDQTWGWDYPLVAMTAARLGEPELAVDALLMDTPKNHYLPNGHNYQRPGLSIYLPGNGGLLAATAMMAAGWDDAPGVHAPGFPDAGWRVDWENLRRMP
ncbi:MAG TPA: hypothetical protein VFG50_10630 [Rhodothermales bacterium]|nr:hypothetical protein [Rhodothermales bacterium]